MKNDIRKTWSVIDEALTQNQNPNQNQLNPITFSDALYDHDHEIKNLLNEHYSSIRKKNPINFLHKTFCIMVKV